MRKQTVQHPIDKKLPCDYDVFQSLDEDDYFMFVNFKLLKTMLTSMCKCPSCGDVIDMHNVVESRMGLGPMYMSYFSKYLQG